MIPKRKNELAAAVGKAVGSTLFTENEYGQAKEQITKSIFEKLTVKIQEMEPRRIVAEESKKIARQKLEGTMFGMFIGGDKINALAEEIGIYAENYIIDNGFPYIEEQVEKEIAGLEGKSLREVGEWVQADGDTVEQKIRDMDVKTLEELVMSVMKRELKMIVNLGALIGLILGCINLLL